MKNLNKEKITEVIILATTSFPLIIFSYFGTFTRYNADDYCTLGILKQEGYLGGLKFWYLKWSGRFTFTALIQLFELLGPKFPAFLPIIIITTWFGVLVWSSHQWLKLWKSERSLRYSAITSAITLTITFVTLPNIYQSIYWMTGIATYTINLIPITGFVGYLASLAKNKENTRPPTAFNYLAFAFFFILGGFSETATSINITLLGILYFFFTYYRPKIGNNKIIRNILVFSGLGAFLAGMVVVIAPGNTIRQNEVGEFIGVTQFVFFTFRHSFAFVAKTFLYNPIPLSLGFAIPFVYQISVNSNTNSHRLGQEFLNLLLTGLTLYVLIMAHMAPSLFGLGAYPESRVLTGAYYSLTISTLISGSICGKMVYARFLRGARMPLNSPYIISRIIILFSGFSLGYFSITAQPGIIPVAKAWDYTESVIESQLAMDTDFIQIPVIPRIGGLARINDDPDHWLNRCVARAYGVEYVISE